MELIAIKISIVKANKHFIRSLLKILSANLAFVKILYP